MTASVVLYGREGCCLCDDARAMLLRARERYGFELVERDIDADDALQRKYLERIPVIEINGAPRFELIIDEAALLDALAQLRSRVPHQ
jgi:glutaredoxin